MRKPNNSRKQGRRSDRSDAKPTRNSKPSFSKSTGKRSSSRKKDSEDGTFGKFSKEKPSYSRSSPKRSSSRSSDSEERSTGRFSKEKPSYSRSSPKRSSSRSSDSEERSTGRFSKEKPSYSRSSPKRSSSRSSDSEERSTGRFSKEKPSYSRSSPKRSSSRSSDSEERSTGRFSKEKPSYSRSSPKRSSSRSSDSEEKSTGRFSKEKPSYSKNSKRTTDRKEKSTGKFSSSRNTKDGGERSDKFSKGPSGKWDENRAYPDRDDRSSKKFSKDLRRTGKPVGSKGKSREAEMPVEETAPKPIRLNRYISNSGVCSRREADELITMGLITVNGKSITELGYKVNPGDSVRYNGKLLSAEKPVYVLMNKPKGFLTTTSDPQERDTVMHIIGKNVKERIYPVGRLDRNTTGLLLLTNDGELAEKLSHPSYNVKKIYRVDLDRPLTRADLQKIAEGVQLEEGRAMVDDVAIVSDDSRTVGIEIHIGWNRVVRRIFEALDYQVTKLDRTAYAGLDKKDLPRGNWRFLREEEIIRLKHVRKGR